MTPTTPTGKLREGSGPAGAKADVLADDETLADSLKRHFGHHEFRPMQRQIVTDAISGRDAFVLMPTGGGKSLCYQLPALLHRGTTIVVSPLIALMQDQVKALEANGISATYLNSTLDGAEIARRERKSVDGGYDLIYMAPERLTRSAGLRLLPRIDVGLFAIDEAHCISEWGHDFRPEYRQLGFLRRGFDGRFGAVPIMALTATATPRVAEDVIEQLHLRDPQRYRGGFERKNLFYRVVRKRQLFEKMLRYIQSHPTDEGIVYSHSRASTEQLAERLRAHGVAALPYHAGLDGGTRHANQHAFVYGEARVIVATVAFGMGIDKPDVRFVLHADLPRHLEAYYQQTGRAGRDGMQAECILYYSAGDRAKIESMIEQKQDEQEREHARWQLRQMIRYAHATSCRCVPLLAHFGEVHDGRCDHCDNCLDPPVMAEATQEARMFLSAVARTGQRFGLGHIVNVLRGSKSQQVSRYGHDRLSVFGIGNQRRVAHWLTVAETLIAGDQLALRGNSYPTAHLTEAGVAVLRGEVQIFVPQSRVAATGPPRAAKVVVEAESLGTFDDGLFQVLRDLRRTISARQGVPPYVVFADVSLRQMASLKPTTHAEMLRIKGVGDAKLDRYGDLFIDTINGYMMAGDGDASMRHAGVDSNTSATAADGHA